MKSIFSKVMLILVLLVAGVGSMNAEKVYADLSMYGDKWDGTDVSFSWTATYGNQLTPSLTGYGLPKGDLRSWEKLVVVVDELTNCDFFRILVYSGDDSNHSNTFKATQTGTNEFTLSGNVDFLNNVTKIVLSGSNWEDTKSSSWTQTDPASFKVKEVYLERPDIVYIEASAVYEAPVGTTDLKNLTGTETNWANTVTYPKELAVQGASFGNGDGSSESTHVGIDGYDYLCFEVTTATENTAGLRTWIWDGSKVVTLYAKPIADYATADYTVASKITGVGTYVVKISGYQHLKGVKAANDWGCPASVVSMAWVSTGEAPVAYQSTGKYVLVGEAKGSATLTDALNDEKATFYDATGVTATNMELTPANTNALFSAGEGVLSNASNVIVSGTCAKLALTDVLPFKAPANFTATAAAYTTTINTTSMLCLPFTATIPTDVEAYTLSYTSGTSVTASTIESTLPANTPVLVKGSGEVTFTGSGAIDAAATNVSGITTGVFQSVSAPQDSYVLEDGAFKKVTAENTITVNPFRAYLTISSEEKMLTITYPQLTGIQDLSAPHISHTILYDLQGRRVAQPMRGIYVTNGKKIFVK